MDQLTPPVALTDAWAFLPEQYRGLAADAAEAMRSGQGADVRRAIDADAPHSERAATPPVPAPDVPARFAGAALDTFDATGSAVLTTSLRVARRFVDRVAGGEPTMLALVGPPGAGKSHLLYGVARALHARGCRVTTHAWYRLADQLRYGRSAGAAGGRVEPWAVREALWSARILLLDEVRPTAGTDFDDTELAKLSCHAYDAGMSVLLTTNVSPLERVMGPAAADRFAQVVVDAPSWRQRRSVAA